MQNLNLNSSSVQELKDNENAAFYSKLSPWTLPPWVVQQSNEGCFCIKPERGKIVADVYTTEADARLMAAAPELLAALQQLLIFHNMAQPEYYAEQTRNAVHKRALNALNQARGQA